MRIEELVGFSGCGFAWMDGVNMMFFWVVMLERGMVSWVSSRR